MDPNPTQYGAEGWTEANVNNQPYDRRFLESAGPFTLRPGAVNYITVGIPWARATQGGAWASVELLKVADDKCQSLFENCFKTLDGPDAPDVTIRELENELIIYLSNDDKNSNNYHETYVELDPQIQKTIETITLVEALDSIQTYTSNGEDTVIYFTTSHNETRIDTLSQEDRSYKFEGYQIYQLSSASVSVTDLGDASKAILIAQCDIKNGAGQLVNWIYNDAIGSSVATEMVNGGDEGISHSFRVTEDKFATGTNKNLVNHKEYYFLVLAYGYNQYKEFSMDADHLDGQMTPYLAGRRNIHTYTAIPHKPVEQLLNANYGDQPMITRIEGQGNGGFFLDLTDESVEKILANNVYNEVQYKNNYGPLNIKVVDPLKVKPFDYTIKLLPNETSNDVNDDTEWQLIISDEVSDEELAEMGLERVTTAAMPISMTNEELFLDLGISIAIINDNFKIYQKDLDDYVKGLPAGYSYANLSKYAQVDAVGSSIEYDGDYVWLSGVADMEGDYPANWIHAGQQASAAWEDAPPTQEGAEANYMKWRSEDFFIVMARGTLNENWKSRGFSDPNQQFESMVNGLWSPYVLSSPYDGGPKAKYFQADDQYIEDKNGPANAAFAFQDIATTPANPGYNQTLTNLYSVDIVLTPDTNLWSRALVLESGSSASADNYYVDQHFNGQTYKNLRHEPKKAPSVDKNGNPDNSGTTGFGWFPGYAINVETGERLNIMFAENSNDELNNGNDMLFNPTNVYAYYKNPQTGELILDEVTGEPIAMGITAYNNYREVYSVTFGEPLNGGRHYVYVCSSSGNTCSMYYRNSARQRNYNDNETTTNSNSITHGGSFEYNGKYYPWYECGAYDGCEWLNAKFNQVNNSNTNLTNKGRQQLKMQLFNNVMWTSIPMPAMNQESNWMACDAKIKLRVSRPYMRYSSRWYNDPAAAPYASQNGGYPMYTFTTKNIAPTKIETSEDFQTVLDEINIVPNPYYGFSNYESTALETYVRIVNLPAKCTISIYTVNGTLIRTLTKGDASTSFVQWDLKNHANIPIASGVYIIHVKADGIGERTLKFFCTMRPTDLNGF